jgi:hypothetical protein
MHKTNLETNLQASGILGTSTFEVSALCVEVSSLRYTRALSPWGKDKTDLQAHIGNTEILADLIYNSVTSLFVGEKL